MSCEVSGDGISVRLSEREGSFLPERGLVRMELMGVSTRPGNVSVNGEEADWSYEETEGKLVVPTEEDADEIIVEVHT